jgi:hypothetical protein
MQVVGVPAHLHGGRHPVDSDQPTQGVPVTTGSEERSETARLKRQIGSQLSKCLERAFFCRPVSPQDGVAAGCSLDDALFVQTENAFLETRVAGKGMAFGILQVDDVIADAHSTPAPWQPTHSALVSLLHDFRGPRRMQRAA